MSLLSADAYLDLALARCAVRWLVDREQYRLMVVGQHHAVEARVQCAHILSHELGKLVEA